MAKLRIGKPDNQGYPTLAVNEVRLCRPALIAGAGFAMATAACASRGAQQQVDHRQADPGHEEGADEDNDHGVGHNLEIGAGHAAHQHKRNKNDDRAYRRAQHGGKKIMDRFLHQRRRRLFRVLLMCPVDLLHYHDGVVDDQADGGGDRTQGHDIEGIADRVQYDQRETEGDRDSESG